MTIRIFNSYEVRIENFVMRVTVWYHEARYVMPNSYPEWLNFHFTPNHHYWFFFLHTLSLTNVFKLEYALFYQFYAKMGTFFIKKCSLIYDVLTSCMRSSYTPWYKTEISRTGKNCGKPCQVCKKLSSSRRVITSLDCTKRTQRTKEPPHDKTNKMTVRPAATR